MKRRDFEADPCACPLCVQAGVTKKFLRRDPHSGKWLHGYDLKRWHEAHDRFQALARAVVGAPGRHANGFEKLAERQPGEDDV